VGPIPFATMVNREWGHTGQNYLKSLLALGFQAFLIMVCVGIYAVLVQNIAVGEDTSIILYMCSAPCGAFQFHILSMLLLRLRRGKKILHIPTYGSIVLFFPLGLL